jgi:hypothetical protein
MSSPGQPEGSSFSYESAFPWYWCFGRDQVSRGLVCTQLHRQLMAHDGPYGDVDQIERMIPEMIPGGVLIPHPVVWIRYRVAPSTDQMERLRVESPLTRDFSVEDFVWATHNAARETWKADSTYIVMRWLGIAECVDAATGIPVVDLECDFTDVLTEGQELQRSQAGVEAE